MRRPHVVLPLILGLLAGQATTAQEVRTLTIESKALGDEKRLNVLLPAGYGEGTERYPVLYLLHGAMADYTQWVERCHVGEVAKDYPLIVVMPDGDNSFYVNARENPKGRWEDHIIKEVIPFIDSRFRTIPDRCGRAIAGLSMGGYGAINFGLRHPDLFASMASHSGALTFARTHHEMERVREWADSIFGPPGSPHRVENDPFERAKTLPPEEWPHIYLDCGSQDFLLEGNREFVAHLAELKIPYEYREVLGGHDFGYWRRNVAYSMKVQYEALERALTKAADSLGGTWDGFAVDPDGRVIRFSLELRIEEGNLRGTFSLTSALKAAVRNGTVEGRRIRCLVDYPAEDGFAYEVTLTGTLDRNRIKGRWSVPEGYDGVWEATKAAKGPGEASRPDTGEAGADLAGTWEAVGSNPRGEEARFTITFQRGAEGLTGEISGPRGTRRLQEIAVRGSELRCLIPFTTRDGEPMRLELKGEVKGNEIIGTWTLGDRASGQWKATRAAAKRGRF